MREREDGRTEVTVHQLVKSLAGEVLSESEVWHVYIVAKGLIERMDLKEINMKEDEGSSDQAPSTAFATH